MSPPSLGSNPTRSSSQIMQMSQHKRSLSFNHHLSYNQVKPMQQMMCRELSQPVQNVKNVPQKGIKSI